MRSVSLNDDPQGSNWWLASDGNWYPPELHPDANPRVRPSAPVLTDEDRFSALFDAAIGVARVQETVIAKAFVERSTLQSNSTT